MLLGGVPRAEHFRSTPFENRSAAMPDPEVAWSDSPQALPPAGRRRADDAAASPGDQPTLAGLAPSGPLRDGDPRNLGNRETDGGLSIGDLAIETDDDLQLVDLAARYELLEELGQGGMGRVMKARDRRLDRLVAIKRLRAEYGASRRALDRFLTEARAIAQLNHFNIVQVYDYGRDAEGPFLILEYVAGATLA